VSRIYEFITSKEQMQLVSDLCSYRSYPKTERPTTLKINGLKFDLNWFDFTQETNYDRVVLSKDSEMLCHYIDIYIKQPFKSVLEFGILQGGGALLFTQLFNLEEYVAVDQSQFNPVVDEILRKQGLSHMVKLHYDTLQNSRDILSILDDFKRQPDLIIGDCSHNYQLTKDTFEMTFPLLKNGGLYVIEDWGWSHWPHYNEENSPWSSELALSNLLFEIVALFSTRPDWIRSINFISPALVVIEKGFGDIPIPFSINKFCLLRGKEISLI